MLFIWKNVNLRFMLFVCLFVFVCLFIWLKYLLQQLNKIDNEIYTSVMIEMEYIRKLFMCMTREKLAKQVVDSDFTYLPYFH